MSQLLIESQYLPPIPVFEKLVKHENLIWEVNENFQKQTFRNRCNILTANGVQTLSVPIVKPNVKSVKDIQINYGQRWDQNHCRAIKTAYGKAAFFEHYFGDLEKKIMSKRRFILDLNEDLMSICLKYLKLQKPLTQTSQYLLEYGANTNDQRGKIVPKTIFPEEIDEDTGYYQLFGSKFVSNLSIIDLLFNEGTNSLPFLYNI